MIYDKCSVVKSFRSIIMLKDFVWATIWMGRCSKQLTGFLAKDKFEKTTYSVLVSDIDSLFLDVHLARISIHSLEVVFSPNQLFPLITMVMSSV